MFKEGEPIPEEEIKKSMMPEKKIASRVLTICASLGLLGLAAKGVKAQISPELESKIEIKEPEERERRVVPMDIERITGDYSSGYQLNRFITESLKNELSKRNVILLVRGEELKKVLEEQDSGKSGRVEPKTAPEIGKIKGATDLLRLSCNIIEKELLGGVGTKVGKGVGVEVGNLVEEKVELLGNMIDTTTGQIKETYKGSGKEKGAKTIAVALPSQRIGGGFTFQNLERSLLGKAIKEAIKNFAKEFAPEEIKEGLVASINEKDKNIILNLGEREGLVPGMLFVIQGEGEEIKDPKTNEVLGKVPILKAVVEVKRVLEKMAVCFLKDGDIKEIQKGDKALEAKIKKEKGGTYLGKTEKGEVYIPSEPPWKK